MPKLTDTLARTKQIFKADTPASRIRAVLLVFAFPAIGHLGLALQEPIGKFIRLVSFDWVKPIEEFQTIQTLWLGAASIHAAVGAVAPILGYTLFATNITSASRIAPVGAVIASEIGWSAYLRSSLLLLAGSLLGLVSAPSLLGMAAAYLAAGYVVLRTLSVFKRGFTLFERPERLDASARKYLQAAIADVTLNPLANKSVQQSLNTLNSGYAALPIADYFKRIPRATLWLGDRYRATQLLQVEPRALERLSSEADKAGYLLQRVTEEIPAHLDRGKHSFLSIIRVADSVNEKELPETPVASKEPDSSHVANLQQLLQNDVVFGAGPWTDDITRLPMLAQRHVATVLYEAMPGERPHDLKYGLDVLSQVIDAIDEKHADGLPYSSEAFDWVTDIPSYLVSQAGQAKHSKALYTREIAIFLRSRLAKWVSDPHRGGVSRFYAFQLTQLLASSLLTDINGAQYTALVIREIPALTRNISLEGMVLIQRALLALLVDDRFAGSDFAKQRKLIITTMRDSVRYGPDSSFDASIRAEIMVASLAIALYQAQIDSRYKIHVEQILSALTDRHAELPFFELLDILKTLDQFDARWDLSGWELQQKESGEAHWMSMHIWITNAAIVALSAESWRLAHLDDSQIPDLQLIGSVLRSLEGEQKWLDLLADETKQSVLRTIPVFQKLRTRRQKIVDEKVAGAGFSPELVRKYVAEVMDDIRSNFGAHNAWLLQAGAIETNGDDGQQNQAGISKLIPKEWFVSNDLLDIPVHFIAPTVSSALVDFELMRISEVLSAHSLEKTELPAFTDERIWNAVDVLIQAKVTHILMLGIGVSEYDVWELLQNARTRASGAGIQLKYQTVRSRSEKIQSVLVVDATRAFSIIRRLPAIDGVPVHQESLRLAQGGVVSGIINIDERMIRSWKDNLKGSEADEMEDKYSASLLDRTAWSFEVVVRETASYTLFIVSSKEQ